MVVSTGMTSSNGRMHSRGRAKAHFTARTTTREIRTPVVSRPVAIDALPFGLQTLTVFAPGASSGDAPAIGQSLAEGFDCHENR
jgi:hypothetical protein